MFSSFHENRLFSNSKAGQLEKIFRVHKARVLFQDLYLLVVSVVKCLVATLIILSWIHSHISQVEALLSKTGGAMPGASASVKQHEAFLEETKALLHPGNFQVR